MRTFTSLLFPLFVASCGGRIDPAQDPVVLCSADRVVDLRQFFQKGASPSDYTMGWDDRVHCGPADAHYIRATSASPPGYAGLEENIDATRYRGKTVRFQAVVKFEGGSGIGSLFISATKADGPPIAITDMEAEHRELRDTTDWHLESISLLIPDTAVYISTGGYVAGGGTLWLAELSTD